MAGVAEATSEADYSLLVSNATHDPGGIAAAIDTGRADGVILMEVRLHDDRVERLRDAGYAFSIIGRCESNEGIPFVDFDFAEAVRSAVAHLQELGHRHVALLNRAPSPAGLDYGPTVRARASFEAATAAGGIQGDHILCGSGGESFIEVLRYLERTPWCTAAITLSQTFVPLLAAMRDLGRSVPSDLSVVSILAPQVSELISPPLTTVDLPGLQLGRLGAEALIRRLAEPDAPPTQTLLRGALRIRSSAPPRQG
jgi:DNA-binding LacI/PurR family transcriptional regulator